MKYYSLPLLAMVVLFSPLAFSLDEPITIIANPSLTVSHLSLDEVRDIYLLHDRQWSDSTQIVVINRPSGSEIRSRFEQKILGIAAKKYALHLERLHYQGVTLPVSIALHHTLQGLRLC